MTKSKIFRSAAVLGAVVIIGAAALSAGPTFAARGGKHGGGQTGGSTGTCSITLWVNGAPVTSVPNNTDFDIRGSGLVPGAQLSIEFNAVGYGAFAQADGTVLVQTRSWFVGSNKIDLREFVNSAWTTCASVTFQVY
jgi:hypothetical protein